MRCAPGGLLPLKRGVILISFVEIEFPADRLGQSLVDGSIQINDKNSAVLVLRRRNACDAEVLEDDETVDVVLQTRIGAQPHPVGEVGRERAEAIACAGGGGVRTLQLLGLLGQTHSKY